MRSNKVLLKVMHLMCWILSVLIQLRSWFLWYNAFVKLWLYKVFFYNRHQRVCHM